MAVKLFLNLEQSEKSAPGDVRLYLIYGPHPTSKDTHPPKVPQSPFIHSEVRQPVEFHDRFGLARLAAGRTREHATRPINRPNAATSSPSRRSADCIMLHPLRRLTTYRSENNSFAAWPGAHRHPGPFAASSKTLFSKCRAGCDFALPLVTLGAVLPILPDHLFGRDNAIPQTNPVRW